MKTGPIAFRTGHPPRPETLPQSDNRLHSETVKQRSPINSRIRCRHAFARPTRHLSDVPQGGNRLARRTRFLARRVRQLFRQSVGSGASGEGAKRGGRGHEERRRLAEESSGGGPEMRGGAADVKCWPACLYPCFVGLTSWSERMEMSVIPHQNPPPLLAPSSRPLSAASWRPLSPRVGRRLRLVFATNQPRTDAE